MTHEVPHGAVISSLPSPYLLEAVLEILLTAVEGCLIIAISGCCFWRLSRISRHLTTR